MADERRLVKFVAKLNRMTQEGAIEWQLKNPPNDLIAGTDDKIPLFFGARLQDRYVGIYVRRYQEYDSDRDQLYWTEKTVLAFCVADWTPIWEFPSTAGIYELLESIQRQHVKVDSFIDKFLAEDDK